MENQASPTTTIEQLADEALATTGGRDNYAQVMTEGRDFFRCGFESGYASAQRSPALPEKAVAWLLTVGNRKALTLDQKEADRHAFKYGVSSQPLYARPDNSAVVKALEEIAAICPARQSSGMACKCELCQIGNIARAALAHRSGT